MKIIRIIIALLFVLSFSFDAFADGRFASEIKRQILENSPWENGDVEVEDIQVSGYEPSLEAFDELNITLPKGMKNIGKVSLRVTVTEKGVSKAYWATARVKVYKDAVVALNALRMNQKITKDDLKLVRMEVRDTPDVAEFIDDVAGMAVKRPIPAGSVIKMDYLKPEMIIKKGEKIILNVESKKLRIKSFATAKEDGSKGSLIAARTNSGRVVNGVVTGPGEIVVEF